MNSEQMRRNVIFFIADIFNSTRIFADAADNRGSIFRVNSLYSRHSVRHEACVNINKIPIRMKEPYNPICRSG